MQAFSYRNRALHVEDVSVADLAATHGTPLYVYSRHAFLRQLNTLQKAFAAVDPLICYSVKANSNLSVIKTFAEGGAGVDIVSGGELFRTRRAGVDASKIVFAGVGKTRDEVEAALRENIRFFTVESEGEAERISECAARLGEVGRIAFRVNPDVDPQTHRYISTGKQENKFGMDPARVRVAFKRAAALPGVEPVGLHMHIGSQILSADPFVEAIRKITPLCRELRDQYETFNTLDIGGGLGIVYEPDDQPLQPTDLAEKLVPLLQELDLQIVMEPGRYLAGEGGILVTRVQYVKDSYQKKFIVVDAAMNDLLRPSFYQAYHAIAAVRETEPTILGDVVGPICESGDFLAQDRSLPDVSAGELLAVHCAGAYGFTMASNYNSRPRPAEILVDGKAARLIRERETYDDLVRGEIMED